MQWGLLKILLQILMRKWKISAIDLKYTLTPLNDNKNGQSCYDAGIKFDSHLVEPLPDVPENEMPVGDEY